MSDAMERIKNKIRSAGGASVHAQLIDVDESANANKNDYVNINVIKRERRKKFEELYKRDTFWVRNELKDELDALCKGERGEKTRIVNEALQEYLKKITI